MEQQPCEDVISRQAALEPYRTLHDNDTISIWLLRKNIEETPPATPKQKLWRWKPGGCNCPACGEDKFKDLDADIWADWTPKFCPNCGAEFDLTEARKDG